MTLRTISQALDTAQKQGLDRLDTHLLLLHALGKPETDRAWLLANDDNALPSQVTDAFDAFSQRRAAGEPLAYIVGYKEFFGLRFSVNARVLVPRPDTETLVQWALHASKSFATPNILDLGTGSGAVAIAVAHTLNCKVTATDFSLPALSVASDNAEQIGANVEFLHCNWLAQVSGHYHVIASNPPYIESNDLHLNDLAYEPLSALAAGADGLSDIRQIIQAAPEHLHPGGWLLLEHGYNQASAVCSLLIERGFVQVQSRCDLAGVARCSGGQWAP